MKQVYIWWQTIIVTVYKLELVDRIRRLANIGWAVSVATIIRLATVGNVASIVKEIIVLIVSKLEGVARTAILSGVAWVGSSGRLSMITRILGISRLVSAGSVTSVYRVTNNNSKSIPAWFNWQNQKIASIGWVGSVARIISLATVGNVASIVKEIIVLIVSKLEWGARTAILSGVAWVGSPGRLSRITRIFGISSLASAGSEASLYMVTNNNSNSIQARISR